MNFIPVTYLITLGAFGLIFGASVWFLLVSCGRLHRLEGLQAWRIAWYGVLIGAVCACLSLLSTGLLIYTTLRTFGDDPSWLAVIETIIEWSTRLAEFTFMGALIVALSHPLRKPSSRPSEAPADP